jgi:hypothetical protein
MLGHSPVILNRLHNIKNSLDASVRWADQVITEPQTDIDFSTLQTLVEDALKSIKEINE